MASATLLLGAILAILAAESARAARKSPYLPLDDDSADADRRDASGTYDPYPSTWSSIPKKYILTNESTLSVVDKVARRVGGRKAVIFTTVRLGDDTAAEGGDVLSMMSNFCSHLDKAGHYLAHTMILTTDERTWEVLRERGLPAFLDRSFPRRREFIDSVVLKGTNNREFDVQKHWWGWKLTSLGFRTLYLDSDTAVLGDLFTPFSHPFGYDVQGLTDWNNRWHQELDPGFTLQKPCMLYRLRPEPSMPTGAAWAESWRLPRDKLRKEFYPLVPNPCQSTAVWYLEPTPITVAFMAALVDHVVWHYPWDWEQTAWNEIIIHYLWGAGDHEPLKYRVLPFTEFANHDVIDVRRRHNLPLRTVVMHMGGLHGKDKQLKYEKLKLWDGNFTWNFTWAPGMVRLEANSSEDADAAAGADESVGLSLTWGWAAVVSGGTAAAAMRIAQRQRRRRRSRGLG